MDKPAENSEYDCKSFYQSKSCCKRRVKNSKLYFRLGKIFVEKLIFDELIKLEMPMRLFTVANLRTQLARFGKRIILPEVARLNDNTRLPS